MSKFVSYYQEYSGAKKVDLGDSKNLQQAIGFCISKLSAYTSKQETLEECCNSLEARGYYMIGFGPAELSIEENP